MYHWDHLDHLAKFFIFIFFSVLDIALIWVLVTERSRSFLLTLVFIMIITIFIAISGRQLLDDFMRWYRGE